MACFAIAFLGTAAALHAAIRDPLHLHADVRSEKLEMLKEWHGRVFSSVFGSSHVHNGFDPRAFDAALAGTPLATRTANLAVIGGSQSEQRAMALQFVQQLESPAAAGAPPQPCLVLLEIGAGANFTNDHLVHPRAINIYDWHTAEFVSHLVAPGMSKMQRVGRVGYAVLASALYYMNIGMLSNEIFAPPLSQEILKDDTEDDRRGEMVLRNNPEGTAGFRKILSAAPAKLPLSPAVITQGNYELVAQLAAATPIPGVSFAYIEMPKLGDVDGTVDFPDHLTVQTAQGHKEVPIINLARPDRFPQLYQPDLWYDDAHLNGQGAALASALLAQQLKSWYAVNGMPPNCGD